MAKTSIIIISYNTRDLTLKCLTSVFKNEPAKEIEVIVVDNASTDGSPEAIKKQFPQVKLILNHQNLGFSKANNQGIAASTGDFILLLNSDTEFIQKNTCSQLLTSYQQLSQTTQVGAIVPHLLNSDRTAQASVYNLPTITNAIRQYWLGQAGAYEKYLPSSSSPIQVEAAVMAAMLIPRSVLNDIGMLDEGYFMYFEDLEFCRRLRQHKFSICYLPTIQILHHHGASGKTAAPSPNQWKRLIPSSKRYHGLVTHYLLFAILWLGQKFWIHQNR